MEAMLAGKSRGLAIGVLRALLIPLRAHWGDLDTFKHAGRDILASEGGGAFYDEKQSAAHLEQLYRLVQRARASYFRPIENVAQLDQLFKELDQGAANSASPLQQGVLWLASRLQQQAIASLQSKETEDRIAKVLEAVNKRRGDLVRSLGNKEQLTLDKVEDAFGAFAQNVLGGTLKPLEQSALAGHLVEILRKAARRPRRTDVSKDDTPRNDAMTALFAAMLEPVRIAELNEAKVRYARMGEDERNRRFNEFRRFLPRIIGEVAPTAPDGFDAFCDEIEVRMFAYPEPLQYIRSFARPIWNNGAQSVIFSNAITPQSVQSTYEQMAKGRQGNPVTLEIARAFAMRNFRKSGQGTKQAVLREADLKREFGWPTTVKELSMALKVAP